MILENPIGLWALTAIIAVLILHRLRQRPERLQVSSLVIWKKIERLLTIAPVRQKSRLYLILMLQILAVIGLALALARPIWRTTQPEPLHLVFLIDNSASMRDDPPDGMLIKLPKRDRWSVVKEKIKEVITKSTVDTTISLYQALPLKSFVGLKRQEVNNALDNLKQFDVPSDIGSLVALTQGVKGEFYFCSDKLPPDSIMEKLPKKPHLILVGWPSSNKAIIRAAATPVSGKAGYYDIFVSIKNYSAKTEYVAANAISDINDTELKLLWSEGISFGAGEKKDFLFKDIALSNKTRIEISIAIDVMLCDNKVLLVPPQPCRVSIAGQDNPALTKALKAIPSVSLNSPPDANDISIFNETLPMTLPAKAIVINSISEAKTFWDYQGRLERPLVSAIDTSSPILKYCDFAVFNNIPYALKLLPKEKEYIKPIITANSVSEDECVLIGEWRKGDRHLVFLNFPLEWRSQNNPTDWTLTPSFPIFWTNLINYLHPVSPDYTLGEGLCNEAESDNNGVTVLDTALPGPEQRPQIETKRVELGHWPIIGAGLCLLAGWLLAVRTK
jgi:hypothetical protein